MMSSRENRAVRVNSRLKFRAKAAAMITKCEVALLKRYDIRGSPYSESTAYSEVISLQSICCLCINWTSHISGECWKDSKATYRLSEGLALVKPRRGESKRGGGRK